MDVQVVEVAPGRWEMVKRAETAGEAARLRREADLLDVAAHPGLVEPVALDDGPLPVLRTVHSGKSLADGPPLGPDEVAGVVAAVATTLADLHALGLVHGAVEPSHVLITGDGRPLLCGLGYGGLAGERPAAAPADEPAGGGVLDPAADVSGLGDVIAAALDRSAPAGSPGPATELRRIAERARTGPAALRPTARQIADDICDSVAGARLPRSAGPAVTGPTTPGRRPPRRVAPPLERWRQGLTAPRWAPRRLRAGHAVVPVAVIALGAIAVLVAVRSSSPGGAAPPADPVAAGPPASPLPGPAPPSGTVVEGSTTTPATVPRRPGATAAGREGCARVGGPMVADVDGDGCPEVVRWADGVVEAGGRRWAVGDPGDVAAVGDWHCAGRRSLALLRPHTGEVFAFPGWAASDAETVATLAGRVEGGHALRAADLDADGCNELVVERARGAPAVLLVPRAPP